MVSFVWIKDNAKYSNKDLLVQEPQIAYGQRQASHNQFAFQLDEYGEAALSFVVGSFNADEFSQLEVTISNLSYNYQVLFVWMVKGNDSPFEVELSQPQGKPLVELLKSNPDWQGLITQIGLRIMPQEHLGIAIQPQQPIIVNRILLKNDSFSDLYGLLAQYWFKYDSLNYRSINHLKVHPDLPIYAQPLVFILVWLLVVVVMSWYFLDFNKIHVMVLVLTAWFLLDVVFIFNSQSISGWLNNIYQTEEEVILPDEDLNKLAQQIKFLLGLNNDRTEKIKRHKVLILSSDRYQRARLIYHMLPVNSSFLDKNAEVNARAKLAEGDYILSYDIARKPSKPSQGILTVNTINIRVKEVAKADHYSIMRVIQ